MHAHLVPSRAHAGSLELRRDWATNNLNSYSKIMRNLKLHATKVRGARVACQLDQLVSLSVNSTSSLSHPLARAPTGSQARAMYEPRRGYLREAALNTSATMHPSSLVMAVPEHGPCGTCMR